MTKVIKFFWYIILGGTVGTLLGGFVYLNVLFVQHVGNVAAFFIAPFWIGAFVAFVRFTIDELGWRW